MLIKAIHMSENHDRSIFQVTVRTSYKEDLEFNLTQRFMILYSEKLNDTFRLLVESLNISECRS